MNATCSTSPGASASVSTTEIDASCRLPPFTLLLGAAVWLVVASILALLASLQFHKPDMFANCACLAYGRVHPAAVDTLLYGFAMQGGLGVALWIIARLGQTTVVQPWII